MANGIFQSLLNRLNRVFNKDPRSLTAFQIKTPVQAKLVIDGNNLTVTAVNSTSPILTASLVDPYDAAKTITVQTLYEQIANTPGFSVQNLNPAIAPLGCIALIEGEYNLDPANYGNIPVATSLLWAYYRPISRVLETAKDDIQVAIQQLSFVTAQSDFLDYWGSIFGIPRYSTENSDGTRNVEGDYEYSLRLLWETVKPRLNNKAIEDILKRGTGLDTTIVDLSSKMLLTDGYTNPTHLEGEAFSDATMVTDSHLDNPNQGFPNDEGRYTMGERYNFASFGVYVDQPLNTPSYQYTEEQIQEIVNRHRAAGTTPWFIITQVAYEVMDLISTTVYNLEGSIDQELAEDRVMFFGHPDQQFYFDHWQQDNVAKMPWLQDNLDKPSLTDNVVMETEMVQKAPEQQTEVEGIFTDGALMDGFLGSMNRNVAYMDSTDTTDDFRTVKFVTYTFPTANGGTEYLLSPVVLKYKRVTDDFITPRIEESFGDDVLTVKATDVTGQVKAFTGAGALTNVLPSGDVVITNPIKVTAPVTITGVKFDEISLSAANLKDLPSIIRNLEIPDLGENWNETYGVTRRYLVPFQDEDGNRFYVEIEIPALNPPPATALRIQNPTADITADHVQITSGQWVTISWNVTQASAATLVRKRLVDGSVVSSQPITYVGSITYQNASAITEDTVFTIVATGNNGQTTQHSVTVRIVAAASTAVAPTITATALPEVVELCSNQQTTIQYTVDFNSKQTETQTALFANGASLFILGPLESDPEGTVVLSPADGGRSITVQDTDTGDVVEGVFTFDSGFAIFQPADLTKAAGKELVYNYDVNYGGSTLAFNGADVVLPDSGEVFQIGQQVTVTVPPPPFQNGAYASVYTVNYEIDASNYAAKSTRMVPVVVQGIQESSSKFAVSGVNPVMITEAIGDLATETEVITLTGTGFSSKMQVFLNTVAADGLPMLVEANIISLDWQNNVLKLIAPRFLAGTYPLHVVKLNCVGETVATDDTQVLQYGKHPTYYLAPEIQEVQPPVMCTSKGVPQDIVLAGNNFRAGAAVSIWKGGAWANKTTTVFQPCSPSGKSALKFSMDETTVGYYNLRVTNTDTSVGGLDNGLRLVDNSTPITIKDFGYKAPLSAEGTCAFYGSNGFSIYWNVDNATYVSFLSSDQKVQTALTSPDPYGYPAQGSLMIPVYTPNTTITLSAVNACGLTKNQTITITEIECEHTTGIEIIPDPLVLKDKNPVKIHCYQHTVKPYTGETFTYEISDDAALSYSLATANYCSLTGKYVAANLNGLNSITASWNGFTDKADIVVQLPEPMALTATPNPLMFNNIGEQYQLKVTCQYTDGSTKDDVSHEATTVYRGYDPNIITVSATGLITTLAAGATHVEVSYVDNSVNPNKVVSTSVQVGKQDPCIGFDRIYVEPSFMIAGSLNVMPIDMAVSGNNTQSLTVMADAIGKASYSYSAANSGTDVVTATYKGKSSSPIQVQWFDPGTDVASTPVKMTVYSGGSSGAINFGGQYWKGEATYSTLYFNDPTAPGNTGQGTRPMKAYTFAADGTCTSQTVVANAGGSGASFQAILTGSFIVKKAGQHTFQCYSDDGFYMGIKGATRISGSNYNVPATTYMYQYPVVGGYNGPEGANLNSITVNFPTPGIYPYEINYASGSGAAGVDLQLSIFCDSKRLNFCTIPTAVVNTVQNGDVTLKLLDPLPLFVGQTAHLEVQLVNLEKVGNVTFNAQGENVRTAILNGTSVYNGQLLNPYTYTLNETLRASKTYQMTISNMSGKITATATASIVDFGTAVINKFTVYDASNPNSPELSDNSLSVAYGSPVGILWNCSNAVRVTLSDSVDAETWDVAHAGSRYMAPSSDRTYTLVAYSGDGSSTTKQISIKVTDYRNYTQDWAYGPWYAAGGVYYPYQNYWFAESSEQVVQQGQSANISLPEWDAQWAYQWWDNFYYPYYGAPFYPNGSYDDRWFQRVSSLSEYTDTGFSTDGRRPTLNPPTVLYENNTQQSNSATMASTTNTFYAFDVTGTWFWYWYDYPYYEGAGYWNGYQWQLPYDKSWSQNWSWAFNTAVNVDPGPKFVSATASATRVTAGQPVTISYETQFASEVSLNIAAGVKLPLGSVSFTVYPDKTQDYTFTAKSPTGLSVTTTVHVDVNPQVLYAPCAQLVPPTINYIAIDGRTANSYPVLWLADSVSTTSTYYPLPKQSGLLTISEQEEVHVLEIFGDHFLGDRNVTPEVTGQVQVLLENNLGQKITGIEITDVVAQSNTYVRCKIHVHPYSVAGTYCVAVMNDVGVSTERGQSQVFNVKVTVPNLLNNQPISATSGSTITMYADWIDPVRDAGLKVMVGTTPVIPTSVGGNLTNTDFVTQLWQQVNGVAPSTSDLSMWVTKLENGTITRLALTSQLVGTNNVSITVGTPIKVAVTSDVAVALGLQTSNGVSDTHVQFAPTGIVPPPVVTPNPNPIITGVTPAYAKMGATVTIYGQNFTNSCTVYVGNTLASSTFVNSTTLTFVVPVGYTATTTTTVMVKLGTYATTYNGFRVIVLVVPDPEPLPEPIAYPYPKQWSDDKTNYLIDTSYGATYEQAYVDVAPTATVVTTQVNNTTVSSTMTTVKSFSYVDSSPRLLTMETA